MALRIAIRSSLAVVLIVAIFLLFISSVTFVQWILLPVLSGIAAGGLVYFISHQLLSRRLSVVNRIIRNIARKRFEEYQNVETGHRDELDYLVTRSLRTSKMVEREIQRLNKIENYRKEFIGDISHELKTPIFAVQGFIETLLNGALEDKQVNRVFLNKAMRNVNRLIYLTKDLMEISRLETGELKSDLQNINLRSVVLDVVESLQHKAQSEKVEIKVADFDNQLVVRADRHQVKQLLINLIENGMKYNRPWGTVEVGVKPYPKRKEKILLYVKDTGIGIEPKDIKRVTERFYRADKSRSREKGGTGLGLSIVKHIIEVHGEELFIESTVNKGSTFSFTLTRSDFGENSER
ncbi:MAG: ATP-binding protein [Balneolaceae bacterium]